jgi:hypothetical protein
MNDLSMLVTKREGKRKSQSIAQIKEMLGIVSDLVASHPVALVLLLKNGLRRKGK